MFLLGLFTLPAMAQSASHFDQPIKRHVNLTLQFSSTAQCSNDRIFLERFPSGNTATEEFTVPGTDLLVITDIHWQAVGEPASFLNGGLVYPIIESVFGSQSRRVAYNGAGVTLTPGLSNSTRISGREHIASGIRIGSGRALCINVLGRTISTVAQHRIRIAELSGYLISK